MEDIVVVGRLYVDPAGTWLLDIDRLNPRGDLETRPLNDTVNAGADPVEVEVVVKADIADVAAAQKAAQNVARVVMRITARLQRFDPGSRVTWGGRSRSVSEALSEIRRTDWEITGEDFSAAGGVGGATRRNPGLRNTVKLDYRYFDGNLSNSGGRDYAAPTYTDDAGLIGIILHEIGHLTIDGGNFFTSSVEHYRREFGNTTRYVNSAYWNNNEYFVNDFALNTATMLEFDITELASAWEFYWVEPQTLYFDRTNQ